MSTATVVATTIAMVPGQNQPPEYQNGLRSPLVAEGDAVVAVAAQQDVDGVDRDERPEHGDAQLERRVERVEEARSEEDEPARGGGRDDARDDARSPRARP